MGINLYANFENFVTASLVYVVTIIWSILFRMMLLPAQQGRGMQLLMFDPESTLSNGTAEPREYIPNKG